MGERPPSPSAADGQQSLREHVRAKALEARAKLRGQVDRAAILRLLEDRTAVRYPVGVRFDAEPLRPGEFACLESLGSHPADGFCLFVHPRFEHLDDVLPLLIAYYVPSINYGDVVTPVEAELYGSTLLALSPDAYYQALCNAADGVG